MYSDATRRRQRLRRLLASVQSGVHRDAATAAVATTTTTAAAAAGDDVDGDGRGGGAGGGPFLSADRAMSFTDRRRARRSVLRQGIVCECCVHHCELGELQGYCASTFPDD